MAVEIKIDMSGVRPLLQSLQSMPIIMRGRILVKAADRAGRTIAAAIRKRVPYQKNNRKSKPHYRDAVMHVTREYPTTASVTTVVGAESGTAPHATLVEEGTKPRFTNHKSQYRRTAVRARVIIKNGRATWVTEKQRKSIGSFQKRNKRIPRYRGIMPAFHPVKLGIEDSRATVAEHLKEDIQAGITREFTEAKIARGL